MPAGVHGNGPGVPSTRRPRLTGCSPSTSLAGSTASRARSSSRPGGSGSCTRKALTVGSALKRAMTSITSSCVAVAGRCSPTEYMPMVAQSSCFSAT